MVNECTLLIESPTGKTCQISINDAKPVSASDTADNALQEFKESALRKEHTHCEVPPCKYMKQSSD